MLRHQLSSMCRRRPNLWQHHLIGWLVARVATRSHLCPTIRCYEHAEPYFGSTLSSCSNGASSGFFPQGSLINPSSPFHLGLFAPHFNPVIHHPYRHQSSWGLPVSPRQEIFPRPTRRHYSFTKSERPDENLDYHRPLKALLVDNTCCSVSGRAGGASSQRSKSAAIPYLGTAIK
jgi:hypothetical protein